jgi:plasmid stabilization system protein ParE
MTRRRRSIHWELEAQLSLMQAADWYGERDPDVADRLLAEVRRTEERLAQFPLSFPLVPDGDGARRALLHRFPFVLMFGVKPNVIRVIAFVHAKQRPGSWQRR